MRTAIAFLLLAAIAPFTHAQSINSVNPALVASVASSPQVASLLKGQQATTLTDTVPPELASLLQGQQSTMLPQLASIIQTAAATTTTMSSSTPMPTNATKNPATVTNMSAGSVVASTAILSISVLSALLY